MKTLVSTMSVSVETDSEYEGQRKTCFMHKHVREPCRDGVCWVKELWISQASSGGDFSLKYLRLQESETIPIPIKGRPAHCLHNEGIVFVLGETGDPAGPLKDFEEKQSVRANVPQRERGSQRETFCKCMSARSRHPAQVWVQSTLKKNIKTGQQISWVGRINFSWTIRSLNTAFSTFLHLCPLHTFVIVSLF